MKNQQPTLCNNNAEGKENKHNKWPPLVVWVFLVGRVGPHAKVLRRIISNELIARRIETEL